MADFQGLKFKKTDRASHQKISFDPKMLEIYIAVDGEKTILEVANQVKMDPTAFKDAFLKLVNLGLIEKVITEEACVDADFMGYMRKTITQLIGPLGGLLIDDTAEEMGFATDRIPVSSLHHFITILAREIPNDKQSVQFRELVYQKMRAMGL